MPISFGSQTSVVTGTSGATSQTVPFTAPLGADVFIAISTATAVARAITVCSYGGVAMTLVANIGHNNSTTFGTTALYRLAGSGSGAAKNAVFGFNASTAHSATIFSYIDVESVRLSTTSFGNNATPSIGPIGCASEDVIVGVIGTGVSNLGSAITATSGGTNRATTNSVSNYAGLAVSDSTATGTTFGTTQSASIGWSGIALVLSPSRSPIVIGASHQTTATGLFTTSSTTYIAPSGSDVFVALSTAVASAHTLNSITYNGTAMTLVAGPLSHSPSLNPFLGYTWLYRAAGAGTGSAAPLAITFSTQVWCCVDACSYSGVGSLGTVTTASGDSTAPSIGPITYNLGERVLSVIGGGSTRVAGIFAPTGGVSRTTVQTSTAYATMAVSDSSNSPTTFGATFSTAQLWSAIAVPLIPGGSVASVPTNQFFQMF
jgi:hypothetical protein